MEKSVKKFKKDSGEAPRCLSGLDLFAHEDRDDQRTFCKCSTEQRLHKNFARSTRIAANSFSGFEADQTKSECGSESGACDTNITSHFLGQVVFVQGFESLRSLCHGPTLKGVLRTQ